MTSSLYQTRRALSSIIVAIATQNTRAALEALEEALREEKRKAVEFIAEWAERNDVQYCFYTLAESIPLSYSRELAEKLRRGAEKTITQAKHSAEIIEAVRRALEENNIPYVVFKTFNKIGRIDVDVDIVVWRRDYWRALKHLYELGLKPVDSVKKTYATGMAKPGNPIILDIHTEITALGMPYLDSSLLLENREYTTQILPGEIQVEAQVAKPLADTIARIAHALVKEAEIRIDDITETLPVIARKPLQIRKTLNQQAIPSAFSIYADLLKKALKTVNIPLHISRAIGLKLLLERTIKRREVDRLIIAATNIRYPRNAAHLAHLLIKSITK